MSYYGFRSVMILYMSSGIVAMERSEALEIYGQFTGGVSISLVLGALAGDFLIGNRRAMIIGGILQMVGFFVIVIQNTDALFVGLILIVVGSGFYSSNLIAQFGKEYLGKTSLSDGGFTFFFLGINFAAPIGMSVVGPLVDYSFKWAFFAAGVTMLLSIVTLLFAKRKTGDREIVQNFARRSGLKIVIFFIGITSLYWVFHSLFYDLGYQNLLLSARREALFESISLRFDLPKSLSIITISFIAGVFWTYFYYNKVLKVILGFAFLALAILGNYRLGNNTYSFFIISTVFLGLSETHVAPVLYSAILDYAKPKYIATLFSLVRLPMNLMTPLVILWFSEILEDRDFLIIVGSSCCILIALIIWGFYNKSYGNPFRNFIRGTEKDKNQEMPLKK